MDCPEHPSFRKYAQGITFELVILCDPRNMAAHSLEIIVALIERFIGSLELYCHLISFDSLAAPSTAESSLAIGRRADLFFVAARCDEDLPESVRDWLQRCISEKTPYSAGVVALLESEPLDAAIRIRTAAYLRETAESKQLDYFQYEFLLAETN